MKHSAFGVCCTFGYDFFLFCFLFATCKFFLWGIVLLFLGCFFTVKRLFFMFGTIFIYFLVKFLLITFHTRFNLFFCKLSLISVRLNVCSVYENRFSIYKTADYCFIKYVSENLFKNIGVFKTAAVIFAKGWKVRYFFSYVVTDKPTVSIIWFNFFDCLTHTAYTEKILYHYDFEKRNRINSGTSTGKITVHSFNLVIDEIKIYRCIYFSQQMILRN